MSSMAGSANSCRIQTVVDSECVGPTLRTAEGNQFTAQVLGPYRPVANLPILLPFKGWQITCEPCVEHLIVTFMTAK